MDKEYKKYIEEITIATAATNYPGVDVAVIRDYMTAGRTPEIECKKCKFNAAPLGGTTYCKKQKRMILFASGCNYGELKPITNGDRIRSMSDEELAERIADGCCRNIDCPDEFYMEDGLNCYGCWLDWLRQEGET